MTRDESSKSQEFEAGMDAATQEGQEANITEGTPTSILRVTCGW